jgi:hypothetical protein
MTELVIVSRECNCDPNHREEWKKRLAITEGQTAVWLCPHVDSFFKRRTEVWERSER